MKQNIIEKELKDPTSKALLYKYYSNRQISKVDGRDQVRHNFHDKLYDENINLFDMYEADLFDSTLGLMMFRNDWAVISLNGPDGKDDSKITLMYGGGTNHLTMNIEQYENLSLNEFKTSVIEKSHYVDKFEGWNTLEIDPKDIFHESGADYIAISAGDGPDLFEEIKAAACAIYLYNEKMETGYRVEYFMNFSEINMSYEARYRHWNRLLIQLLLTYIKPNVC